MRRPSEAIEQEGTTAVFLSFIRIAGLVVSIFATHLGLRETMEGGFWNWLLLLMASTVTAAIAYYAWGVVMRVKLMVAIVAIIGTSCIVLPGSVYWSAIYLGSRAVFFDELKTQIKPLEEATRMVAHLVSNEEAIEIHLEGAAQRFKTMSDREVRKGAISSIPGKAAVAIALEDIGKSLGKVSEKLKANGVANQAWLLDLRRVNILVKKIAYGGKITQGDICVLKQTLVSYRKKGDKKFDCHQSFYDDYTGGYEGEHELEDVSLTLAYQVIQAANALLAEINQSSQREALKASLVTLAPALKQAVSDNAQIADAQRSALESVQAHLQASRKAIQGAIDNYPGYKTPKSPKGISVAPAHQLVLTYWRKISGQWLTALAIDYGPLICVLFTIPLLRRKEEKKKKPAQR